MRRPLVGGIVVAVAIVVAACADFDQAAAGAPGAPSILDSADQVAFGSRTLVTDGGLLRAEIFADTTFFLDQSTRIVMRVVHGDFYNSVGSKDATMVADRANYDTRLASLEGWGNVVITSVDGRVLRSPMVRYDSRQNQLLSDSSFVMTEPDGKEVRGIGFRADPNLNVVTVLRLNRGCGGGLRFGRVNLHRLGETEQTKRDESSGVQPNACGACVAGFIHDVSPNRVR
jgi:hypothetical protein